MVIEPLIEIFVPVGIAISLIETYVGIDILSVARSFEIIGIESGIRVQEQPVHGNIGYKIYKEPAKEYKISFRQANAQIKAAFDNNGSLLWSFEKYKNMACPENVRNTLITQYSEWNMKSNTYFVHYSKAGELIRVYMIQLENGNKKQAIELNPEGKHFDNAETSIPFELATN